MRDMELSGKSTQKSITVQDSSTDLILCNYCNRRFSSVKGMLSHLHVNKASFSCDNCSIVFTNRCAFQYHVLLCKQNVQKMNEINKDESNCKLNLPTSVTVDNTFSNIDNVITTVKSQNESKRLKAENNEQESITSTSSNEYQHEKECEDKLVFLLLDNASEEKICPICNYKSENNLHFRIHSRSHGTVFLKYCQERLYRGMNKAQIN